MANQSIDPALLALQTAKKAMSASPSTQAVAKPSLNVPKQQSQAISTNITPPVAKIGGISSPFGATNINSTPVLGGATPQEIGTVSKELQSLPKAMPATGSEPVKKLSIDDFANKIKEKYPEYKDKDNKVLAEAMIKKYPEYQDKIELNQPTTTQNVAGGLVQSATGLPSLGAKIANPIFGAVDKYIVDPLSRALGVDEAKIQANTARAEQARSNIIGGLDTAGQKLTGGDPESTAFKTAKLVGDIGQTIITPNAPGLTKGAGLLKGAGQLAGQGLAETVKYSAIADQRLPTKEELAYGVGGNVLIGGAIAGLSKIKPIKDAFAESLREGARTNVAKALAPTGKKYKQLTDRLTDEFLDRGLRGSKESLLQSAKEGVEKFGAKIDDAIAGGALDNVEIPTQPLKELLKEAKKSVMVGGNVVNTAKAKVIDGLEDVLIPFQNTIGGKEARRFKQILDEIVYSTKGGIGAEDMTYKNILSKGMADVLRKQLSEAAPDLAKLNKDFSFYKSLEDVLEATMLRQRPQQGAVRKFIAGAFAGNQEGVVNKVIGYVGSKLFLDATSGATRNTLSAVAKNKLANAIATGSPKIINSVVQEMNDTHGLGLPLYDDVAVGAGNTMLKGTNIANTPKPTPKTPPITVEKGAIGMGTPKPKVTPVIPPKATVAPSVSAPKIDTFKRMTELDSNPLYKKLTGGEILGGGKIKQGLFETPLGTITNEIMDGKVKKYIVNGKTYNASDLGGIREKQAPEVVAQANKTSKAISDLKAIESGKGNVMGSSLRSVLDDLGIKDVNSIPEGTEADILQMVRARKPVAPKKGMPKLGKEVMEQNITQGDDLISEAKKYKSAYSFIEAKKYDSLGLDKEFFTKKAYGRSDQPREKVGTVGDAIKDTKLRKQFVDVLDIPIYKSEGGVGIAPGAIGQYQKQFNRIVIDFPKFDDINVANKIEKTFFEEVLHSLRSKKGRTFDGETKQYLDRIEEITAKKGSDYFGSTDKLKQIREQANKKPLPPLPKKGK